MHDFRIFSLQLRSGKLHREPKLRFRNRFWKKQDLHMQAKSLVYFLKIKLLEITNVYETLSKYYMGHFDWI